MSRAVERKVHQIRPQPGPQYQFLSSSADIAIYGGSAGGGKSYALLLEPLRHINNGKFSAVIFRRTLTDVKKTGSLWDTSMELYGAIGAKPISSTLTWEFGSGSKITFGHLEHENTVLNWQGSQVPLLCVAVGTKVRMADGSLLPIEQITIGDKVMTLRGSRNVTSVSKPQRKQCVEATIGGEKQLHPTDHPILTADGWLSWDDLKLLCAQDCASTSLCGPRRSEPPIAKRCCARQPVSSRISEGFSPLQAQSGSSQDLIGDVESPSCEGDGQSHSATSGDRLQARRRPQSLSVLAARHVPYPQLSPEGQESGDGTSSDIGSQCSLPDRQQLPLRCARLEPIARPRLSEIDDGEGSSRGSKCGSNQRHTSTTSHQDFLGCCSRDQNLCGEHPLRGEEAFQCHPQQPSGVERPFFPSSSRLDATGHAQEYSHAYRIELSHPYTSEERVSSELVCFEACEIAPVGVQDVIDITVDGENHYITESGLVNKNCFDELTHFSRAQFFYMMSRNRSASGVRPYIRATTNPDSDSWVAEFISWWIDQTTGLPILERSGAIRWFVRVGDILQWADTRDELLDRFGGEVVPKSVTFVPARLEDNAILMQMDPGYRANLLALPRVERERLLGGNWKVRPSSGLYFRREYVEIVDAIPAGTDFVRGWDLGATEKTSENDPDWTAGTKIGRMPDGRFIVAHHTRMQESPLKVERAVLNTASADGRNVRIALPQDPGQAGKDQALRYVRMLAGYNVHVGPATGDKITRFSPFSAQAESGNVVVLRGAWNDDWFTVLENFPEGAHDDDVDSTSEAFNRLCARGSMTISDDAVRASGAGARR